MEVAKFIRIVIDDQDVLLAVVKGLFDGGSAEDALDIPDSVRNECFLIVVKHRRGLDELKVRVNSVEEPNRNGGAELVPEEGGD